MINLEIIQNELEHYDGDIWNIMKERSKKYIARFIEKTKCRIKINEEKYILICPLGDEHLGSDGTDYELAEKHAKMIGNCEYALAFDASDTTDNFINSKILDAIISSSTTPKQQIKLFQTWLEFFKGNYILSISGNHQNWSKKVTGIDWLAEFMKKNNVIYNRDEMRIYIDLCGIEYCGLLRHKVRYNSVYNKTHGIKQVQRLDSSEIYDFAITAHLHTAAVEMTRNFGKPQLYMRTGTYKIVDPYAFELGYGRGYADFPCFIINPFEKSMTPFFHLETGIKVVEALNRKLK
jgi:hypothetical protein